MRKEITLIVLISLTAICLFSSSAWEKNWNWVCEVMAVLGSILLGAGVAGRVWSLVYICGHKNHRVVREGPYSICRNPLYFFSFVAAIGTACATETLLLPAIVLIFFAVLYPRTIKREESRLLLEYPMEYQDYMRTVPRFFPRWSLLQETQDYSMNPKIFRRQLAGIMGFVWFFCALRVIVSLHQIGWLPAFFHLY